MTTASKHPSSDKWHPRVNWSDAICKEYSSMPRGINNPRIGSNTLFSSTRDNCHLKSASSLGTPGELIKHRMQSISGRPRKLSRFHTSSSTRDFHRLAIIWKTTLHDFVSTAKRAKKTGICKVIGLAPATHSLNEIKWNNCHLLVQRGNWAHASHNWRRIVTSVL